MLPKTIPKEVREQVGSKSGGMSYEEACERRQRLMDERKQVVATSGEGLMDDSVSLRECSRCVSTDDIACFLRDTAALFRKLKIEASIFQLQTRLDCLRSTEKETVDKGCARSFQRVRFLCSR